MLQELAADIANFGSQKEQRTKAAQAKLKAAKAGLESAKKAAKDAVQKVTQAVAEAEAAATERASLEEQLQAAHTGLTGELSVGNCTSHCCSRPAHGTCFAMSWFVDCAQLTSHSHVHSMQLPMQIVQHSGEFRHQATLSRGALQQAGQNGSAAGERTTVLEIESRW